MAMRKGFTSAQKFTAALTIIKGEKSQVDVGKEMSCHPSLVGDWRTHLETNGSAVFDREKTDIEKDKRIAKLEHLIGRLTIENGFLERVLGRHTGA
jgi:transposase-like protein